MYSILKNILFLLVFISMSILLTNCNLLFTSRYQKISINTNSDENEVYLDDDLVCKGKSSTIRVKKNYVTGQIIVLRKGYKPVYDVILKTKRPTQFYPLLILDIASVYGIVFSGLSVNLKCKEFENEIKIKTRSEESFIPIRKKDEKYIDISKIIIDIQDKTKDIVEIYAKHSDNLLESLKISEEEFYRNRNEIEQKLITQKQNENRGKKLEFAENELKIQANDSKISNDLVNILKQSNFIDTVNKIFNDENNTLVLEASIKKITYFLVSARWDQTYCKAKLNLTWYIKNTYDEKLDSVETIDYSGNFRMYSYMNQSIANNYKYIGDAVLNSYLNLTRNKTFSNNIKVIKDVTIKEEKLQLNMIASDIKVTNKSDAFKATVIVKSKENNKFVGHGSGFAISKDGYVLTNYHVIAGKYANKQNEISVITSTGQELPAKIVRFNKFRDVALLKIDYSFEKVFDLENKNKAEIMMDVLTIGAPKSIELGQSVTTGIISNIRNENENKYLQLGMAINGGNSGGAIFDAQGNLHGIVVSKLVGYSTEGVGFAIPSYMVAEYLNLEVK